MNIHEAVVSANRYICLL